MAYFIVDNTFNSPYFIFIQSDKNDKSIIFEILKLNEWNEDKSEDFEKHLNSDNRHCYTTYINGWTNIMDDWNYTLWFDPEIIPRLKELSKKFKVFTCSIGDSDESFDFRLFDKGEIVREYVVEDPNYNGGHVTKNFGTPIQGEQEALKKTDITDKVLSIARILGIKITHKREEITAYFRAENEDEKFEFDESEY